MLVDPAVRCAHLVDRAADRVEPHVEDRRGFTCPELLVLAPNEGPLLDVVGGACLGPEAPEHGPVADLEARLRAADGEGRRGRRFNLGWGLHLRGIYRRLCAGGRISRGGGGIDLLRYLRDWLAHGLGRHALTLGDRAGCLGDGGSLRRRRGFLYDPLGLGAGSRHLRGHHLLGRPRGLDLEEPEHRAHECVLRVLVERGPVDGLGCYGEPDGLRRHSARDGGHGLKGHARAPSNGGG